MANSIKIGERVLHSELGSGTYRGLEDGWAVVRFDSDGTERCVQFTNLTTRENVQTTNSAELILHDEQKAEGE